MLATSVESSETESSNSVAYGRKRCCDNYGWAVLLRTPLPFTLCKGDGSGTVIHSQRLV